MRLLKFNLLSYSKRAARCQTSHVKWVKVSERYRTNLSRINCSKLNFCWQLYNVVGTVLCLAQHLFSQFLPHFKMPRTCELFLEARSHTKFGIVDGLTDIFSHLHTWRYTDTVLGLTCCILLLLLRVCELRAFYKLDRWIFMIITNCQGFLKEFCRLWIEPSGSSPATALPKVRRYRFFLTCFSFDLFCLDCRLPT